MIFHSFSKFIDEKQVLGVGKSSVDVISVGSNMIVAILGSTMVMKVGVVLLVMKVECVYVHFFLICI